jgi:MFS transporter, DHA1 family, tetracycline resistance protein
MADATPNPRQQIAGQNPSSDSSSNPMMAEPQLVATDTAFPPQQPSGRRAAAAFIFLTVTLDMLALGMIAPVLPRLIEGFLNGDTSTAAKMLGLFGTVFAAMQFFFSPILGSLSDRFGRRPVVLLSNFGLGLDYLLMAWSPALSWLFLGRVISGLTSSSIPTAMAYMADVTPHERRAAAFGMLNAAFGIGFVLGPAMGGLLGNINPRLPFWVAGGLSLLNGLYGLFVLPESLSKQNRSPFSWGRANPIGSLTLLRRGSMLAIAGLLLLGYIAQQSLMNVYVIYADYRYHWTDRTVGFSLATVGIFTAIYGAFLVKPVVAKLGERGAITLGLIGGAIGYSMFGFSKTGILFWLGIPFLNLTSFTWPAAQSILSRKTSPSEQGQLQGAINSLRGIAGLVGPGLFTYIFSRSIGADAILHLPGAPFYAAAAMLFLALLLAQRAASAPQPAH